MEKELYKVYHYCFYADTRIGYSGKEILNYNYIKKDTINAKYNEKEERLELIGWNEDFFIYDDNDEKANILKKENFIQYEYFTTDDKNGYERFINWLLKKMAENILVRENKVAE